MRAAQTAEKRWEAAQNAEKQFWKGRHFDFQIFPKELELLKKHHIKTENKKILEIGSGPTGIVNVLKGKRYAIDPLMDLFLSNCDLPKQIKYIRGKGEDLPFADKFFDIIFCLNTLDHVDSPYKILKESYRCLKKDGLFFIALNCYSPQTVWIKEFSENIGAGDICHPHSYTTDKIKNALISQGFEIIEIKKGSLSQKDHKGNILKVPTMQKLLSVIESRGAGYVFKRALVLPFHALFGFLFKNYPNSLFLCKKVGLRNNKTISRQ